MTDNDGTVNIKTIVSWIGVCVLLVGIVVRDDRRTTITEKSIESLTENQTRICADFTKDIERVKTEGTLQAKQNSVAIAVMQNEQYNILKTVQRIEADVKEVKDWLKNPIR